MRDSEVLNLKGLRLLEGASGLDSWHDVLG